MNLEESKSKARCRNLGKQGEVALMVQLLGIWEGDDAGLCCPGLRISVFTGTGGEAVGSQEESDGTIWNFHPSC